MVTIRIGIVVYFLVCISFPIDSAAEKLDDQYIGCYKDNDTVRDLGNLISSDSMTISFCIDYCQNNNKTYAGIQNGNTCFCGDTYGTYGPSKNCNVSCLGDTSYYCGGHLQNSIYAVCPFGRYWTSCNRECHCTKEAPCYLSNGTCPSDCAAGWNGTQCNGTAVPASSLSYHGCYTDARTNGFPLLFRNTTHLSIQLCMDRCRIYFGLYIGLQYAQECYCGNSSYSNNGTSDKCGTDCPPTSLKCNCSGSPTDRCGGAYANDVYSACQSGYYGVLCSHQCHCLHEANCTMENGTCPQGACAAGWTGMSCNIRDCLDNNGDCRGENEICTDEKTGEGAERVVPRCRCKEGYSRHREYEPCTDVNECELTQPENECDASMGKCFNLFGSYNCTCFEGFTNNGNPKACEGQGT